MQFIPDHEEVNTSYSMMHKIAERICNICDLQEPLDLHKYVSKCIDSQWPRAVEIHNAATNIFTTNFGVGDFVDMVKETRPVRQILFHWCRPRMVLAVKLPAVLVVSDLLTKNLETVHASRIKKCLGALDSSVVAKEVLDLSERTTAKYEVAQRILEIDKNEEGIWIQL